ILRLARDSRDLWSDVEFFKPQPSHPVALDPAGRPAVWNCPLILKRAHRKTSVGPWLDVVPGSHVAGSGCIVDSCVDDDLVRENCRYLRARQRIGRMRRGECICPIQLKSCPTIGIAPSADGASFEAVALARIKSCEGIGDDCARAVQCQGRIVCPGKIHKPVEYIVERRAWRGISLRSFGRYI